MLGLRPTRAATLARASPFWVLADVTGGAVTAHHTQRTAVTLLDAHHPFRNAMALLVTSLALKAALVASGMHRAPCFAGSSPSLRRSAPLLVQTWQPNEEHPNEAPATAQPRAEVGASFGLLRGRSTPRRELASEWMLIFGYRAYTTYRCGDAGSGVEQGGRGEE